jgi:hypothetical protein
MFKELFIGKRMKNRLKYSIILFSLLLTVGGVGFLYQKNNPLVCVEEYNHFSYCSQNEGFLLEKINMPKGHKIDCQCCMCKAKRGETKGIKKKPFTLDHKRNLSLAHLGVSNGPCSESRKLKISKKLLAHYKTGAGIKHKEKMKTVVGYGFSKGSTPWNKNTKGKCLKNSSTWKKGNIPWNKGKSWDLKTRKKMSLVRGGDGLLNKKKCYIRSVFNKELKEKIKKKNNYSCFICKEDNKELVIHHIDYNIKNNKEENLVSLCRKCHNKTNFNRGDWIIYFTKTYVQRRPK